MTRPPHGSSQFYGPETRTGLAFLHELVVHMIATDTHEYRLPNLDITFDYSTIPFRIAKADKIVKVLRHYSEAEDDQPIQYFRMRDEETGREYTFTFRRSEDGKYQIINMVET